MSSLNEVLKEVDRMWIQIKELNDEIDKALEKLTKMVNQGSQKTMDERVDEWVQLHRIKNHGSS